MIQTFTPNAADQSFPHKGKPFYTIRQSRRGIAGQAWKEAVRKKSTFPHFLIRLNESHNFNENETAGITTNLQNSR